MEKAIGGLEKYAPNRQGALFEELEALTGRQWSKAMPGLLQYLSDGQYLSDEACKIIADSIGLFVEVARRAHSTGVQRGSASMARTYSDALAATAGPTALAQRPYEIICPGCSKDLGLTQAGPNRSQVIDPDVIAAHYAESPACGQIVYLGANRAPDPEGRPGA